MLDRPGIGPHQIVPFSPERNATIDTLRWARKRLDVSTLLEIDVTATRRAIRSYRRRTGNGLSFTAWVVRCIARAAAEHPRVHALRRGRRMVLFHEVDVAVVIERAIRAGRETVPMPYVVRKANEKSASQIHEEIRRAQGSRLRPGATAIDAGPGPRLQSLFFRLPAWLRDLVFWRWFLRSPFRIKRTMGTIVVTAPGSTVPGVLAWGIPAALHPLAVGIGGIAHRSTQGGKADVLALSLVFDHAVVDGAPVGRFARRMHELMTQPAGLGELEPAGAEPLPAPGPEQPGSERRGCDADP